MTVLDWPEPGHCGACHAPACRYPSGEWVHLGRPCRARTQVVWGVHDAEQVRRLLRFVPAGAELPAVSEEWRAWMRGEAT